MNQTYIKEMGEAIWNDLNSLYTNENELTKLSKIPSRLLLRLAGRRSRP